MNGGVWTSPNSPLDGSQASARVMMCFIMWTLQSAIFDQALVQKRKYSSRDFLVLFRFLCFCFLKKRRNTEI